MVRMDVDITPCVGTTFADLQDNALFTRVRVKGYQNGVKPQTVYRKVAGKAIIAGYTSEYGDLHNGDRVGMESLVVGNNTPVTCHGFDNSCVVVDL